MFRPQPISSTDARKHFTRLIKKVSYSSKSFVIQSYHESLVRIVNENYIRALEEVVGKKTVNQVMQIAGNDQLFEAEKIEQIKKTFQRRLSGSPKQQPKPRTPKQQPPASPKPQPQPKKQENKKTKLSQPQQKSKNPNPPTSPPDSLRDSRRAGNPQPRTSNNRAILLSNGKNYK